MIAVITAHKEGKAIESYSHLFGDWFACTNPAFDFGSHQYRIKPEPQKPTAEDYLAAHKASGLKVGDKVRVMRKAVSREGGWDASWNDEYMTPFVGGVFTIWSDRQEIGFELERNGEYFYFPYFVLEKVEPKVIWVNLNEEAGKYEPHCGYDSEKMAKGESESDDPIRTAVKFIEVLD